MAAIRLFVPYITKQHIHSPNPTQPKSTQLNSTQLTLSLTAFCPDCHADCGKRRDDYPAHFDWVLYPVDAWRRAKFRGVAGHRIRRGYRHRQFPPGRSASPFVLPHHENWVELPHRIHR